MTAPVDTPRRIAVFRALHLGDLICAGPALRALREWAPAAQITLLGLPWAAAFAQRCRHWIDDFAEYPEGDGYLEGRQAAPPEGFIRAQRRRRYDLAIQMHGSGGRSNALVHALGARRSAGFHPPGQPPPGPGFLEWRDQETEIRRWLRLVRHLGAPHDHSLLEFPISASERRAARALCAEMRLQPDRYIVIHPGARLATRRWPLERFAAVGSSWARRGWGLAVTGTAEEAHFTSALSRRIRGHGRVPVADLGGRCGLGVLAALVAEARLLVSNDTGLSHVAAAVRTPSVIVSSGGDAARWAPLDRRRHRVLAHDVACRPCEFSACPHQHECARGIGVAHVNAVIEELLEDFRHAA